MLFVFFKLRHTDTILQYPNSLNEYSDTFFGIQIPFVQQSLSVSECSLEHSNWLSGIRVLPPYIRIPSTSAARSFLQRIQMLVKAFEYPFRHPNALVRHSDTPQQNLKIFSSKSKNCLFSIKIVYCLYLLKIMLVYIKINYVLS